MTTTTQERRRMNTVTCTCPMALRARGEHSVVCPARCQHHESWMTATGCALCAAAPPGEQNEAAQEIIARFDAEAVRAKTQAHSPRIERNAGGRPI